MPQDRPLTHRALVSAHRCGRKNGTDLDNNVAGVREAARLGADYVEFDIQRCVDGTYLCCHDHVVALPDGSRRRLDTLTAAEVRTALPHVEPLTDLLAAVAEVGLRAHLDLKFVSPADAYADPHTTWEVECARLSAAVVGPENMILTTTEDASVAALRAWVRTEQLSTLVGLSLGRHTAGMSLRQRVRTRLSELYPDRRVRACDPTLLVPHHLLAQIRLLRWAHRRNLPVLVWTVDHHRFTRRLMRDHRVWLLTTNWPERALAARAAMAQLLPDVAASPQETAGC